MGSINCLLLGIECGSNICLQVDNMFSGSLPTFLFGPGSTRALQSFDASINRLTGRLPIDYLAGILARTL